MSWTMKRQVIGPWTSNRTTALFWYFTRLRNQEPWQAMAIGCLSIWEPSKVTRDFIGNSSQASDSYYFQSGYRWQCRLLLLWFLGFGRVGDSPSVHSLSPLRSSRSCWVWLL